MPAVLPSLLFEFSRAGVRALLGGALLLAACTGSHQPPVQPGPRVVADPPIELRGMVEECEAMIGALQAFKACPNLDADDRRDLDAWIERANKDFAAGRKASPEQNAQNTIAMACLRATRSVEAATERCVAGPKPKDAWYLRRR